ncbi:hypothetical protein Tco_0817487 [Tanacetum coccineum]
MVKSSSSLCKELILREIASEIHSWGPYQYRMIKEPDDLDHTPPVLPSSHLQTDDELTTEEAKRRKQSFSMSWERFTSLEGKSIELYYYLFVKLMNDLDRNQLTPKNIACNLKFLNNLQPKWKRYVTHVHQTKKLQEVDYNQLYDYLKQNHHDVNKLRAKILTRTHDPLAFMAKTQTPYSYLIGQNGIRNQGMQNVGNQTGLIAVPAVGSQNANVVAPQAENNGNGNNENQIRRDVAYLKTKLFITQKEEAGTKIQAEEFDLMVAAADCKEIKEMDQLRSNTDTYLVQKEDNNVIPLDPLWILAEEI